MASYSIVLNLTGNAVSNSKTLADNLERADRAAKSLKKSLTGVRVPTGGTGSGRPSYGSTFGNVSAVTSFSTQSGLGTVFRFAGSLNVALAVIDSVVRAATKAVKIVGKANLLAYTGGFQLLNKGADILLSSQMGEGIRLLQRRQQARLGFKDDFAQAQERAYTLAASYGFDPSNVLASMNVLTGMRVGDKRLTAAHAERLTQVGGLIAQQSGMGFETVMINLQQIMAQAVPSMRDIRQLLTHAPILGRYALDEMAKRGITGMTAMEYMKADKGALMTVLERYLSENPAILSMKARGMVQRSKTEFYATLAENPAWLTVAGKYTRVMKDMSTAFSSMLTALADSQAIRTSIHLLTNFLKDAPSLMQRFAGTANKVLIKAFEILGFPVNNYKEDAQVQAATEGFLSEEIRKNVKKFRPFVKQLGLTKTATDEDIVRSVAEFAEAQGLQNFAHLLERDPLVNSRTREISLPFYTYRRTTPVVETLSEERERRAKELGSSTYMFGNEVQSYVGATIDLKGLISSIKNKKLPSTAPLTGLVGGEGLTGEDISGFGRDRKSLTINFNAPIVEWDSTINADDPQDVVNTVSETIEGAATRAIQIALLGATGKMDTRF